MLKRLLGPSQPDYRQSLERQAALAFLLELEKLLPELAAPWRSALQSGQSSPGSIARSLGERIAALLAEAAQRQAELEFRLRMLDGEADFNREFCRKLLAEPVRDELRQAQAAVEQLTGQLAMAEADLRQAQQALLAEQRARQSETERLQRYIADQNRIIAQQQLRLNNLLGETPGAETPGGD